MSLLRNGELLKCRHGAQTDIICDGGIIETIRVYRGPNNFGGELEIEMVSKTWFGEAISLRGVVHLKEGDTFRTPLAEYEGV